MQYAGTWPYCLLRLKARQQDIWTTCCCRERHPLLQLTLHLSAILAITELTEECLAAQVASLGMKQTALQTFY